MGEFSKRAAGLALAVIALAAGPALADPIEDFASTDGFSQLDTDLLFEEINAALAPTDPTQSVFHPTADVGPVPMAMLALHTREANLERVRYKIDYGVDWVEESTGGMTPVSYVEVTRFNLGPSVWKDLAKTLGEEVAAPVEEFGVGPHVAYRLVTHPVMGNRAMLLSAGRREIADIDAAAAQCLSERCLLAHSPFDELVPWSEMAEVPVSLDAPYATSSAGVITPVAAADYLVGDIVPEQAEGVVPASGFPRMVIELVIDTNLGQDLGLEAAYRWGGLLDDSLSAIWKRLASVSFGSDELTAVYEAETFECARGDSDFPEPGQYCP